MIRFRANLSHRADTIGNDEFRGDCELVLARCYAADADYETAAPVKTDFILTPKDILKPFITSANGSQFDNTDRAFAVVHLNVYLLQRLGIGFSLDKEIAFGQQHILTQALGA